MKKCVILLFILVNAFAQAKAQELVTPEQFQKLIGYLNDENWSEAAKLSESYLISIPKDKQEDDAAAILRYMYLTSESGLMNLNQITQEKALVNVSKFSGHSVILPWRSVSIKYGTNYVQLVNNKPDTLMVTATNKKATQIFCFEYIVPTELISLAEFNSYNGKMCRISGQLKSIKVEGHMLPRFRLLIDNAKLYVKD